MGGFMSGSQFGVKVGWRVGIFLALTIGFPFIVYGLILVTGARSVGGAVGAVAVVAGVFLKPVFLLGFAISLFAPCWQRMRSLGFPGFIGLLAPFLFLMDWPYLLVTGAHWGVGFSLGILNVKAPLFAMSALAMLIAMVVASPPDDRVPSQRMAGWIGGVLAAVLLLIALVGSGTTLWFLFKIWFMPAAGNPPSLMLPLKLSYLAGVTQPFICSAFCMAIAAMAYLSSKESSGHSPGDSEPGGPSLRPPPLSSANSGAAAFGRR